MLRRYAKGVQEAGLNDAYLFGDRTWCLPLLLPNKVWRLIKAFMIHCRR